MDQDVGCEAGVACYYGSLDKEKCIVIVLSVDID